MRVIFLDMDGVCNSQRFLMAATSDPTSDSLNFGEGQIDPKCLVLVDELVGATDAHIVISSSWRHIWDWKQMAKMLKNRGLKSANRIIGQTPEVGPTPGRGSEVQEWLDLHEEERRLQDDLHPIQSYVILDDTDEFDSEQHRHFVKTNPQTGLTRGDVRKAVAILKRGN